VLGRGHRRITARHHTVFLGGCVTPIQFDPWGVTPSDELPWKSLREKIQAFGLRNSLLIAMAPTATIASIAGCYECIEPQVGNMFKQETLRLPPQSAVLCKGYDPTKESLGGWRSP
ncbi:MAG: hypothetical protein RMJ98_13105, partial [Myxococcales bacterium]|nr:hypothetical protein [Myxococcales bacterium]